MVPRVLLVAFLVSAVGLSGCFTDDAAPAALGQGASKAQRMLDNPPGSDVVPTGRVKEFDLYLHRMNHELYPGASMAMWGFSFDSDPSTASFPGPTMRVTEGDTVIVRLQSTFAGFNHTLHFHGQNVPWTMDGVPYVSQDPVEPGDVFTYNFIAKPAGTYWYHCHVDTQHHVDMGMLGAFIVDPQNEADDPRYDGEFLMILDDMDRFHLEGGQPATGNMPQSGDPESYEEWLRRTGGDVINRNEQTNGALQQTPARQPRDWYPVTYAPYTAKYNTYLINGFAFPYTPALTVEEGKVYRIRMINVANEVFAMHLHGHHVLVTHKDGVLLESPYWSDTVLIGPAERYDVYLKADNIGVWDFHSHVGRHTQNDNVFPGGAMTMLCYTALADACSGGGHAHGGSKTVRSGDLVRWYAHGLP